MTRKIDTRQFEVPTGLVILGVGIRLMMNVLLIITAILSIFEGNWLLAILCPVPIIFFSLIDARKYRNTKRTLLSAGLSEEVARRKALRFALMSYPPV